MWRSVVVLVLTHSLLGAQEPNVPAERRELLKQTLRQDYHVLTEWQTMKLGTSEKAVVRFFLIPSYVVSPYEPSRDLAPLKIEFEESEGVAATSFRFDTDRWVHFTFREKQVRKEQMLQPPGDDVYSISGDPRVPGNLKSSPADITAQQNQETLRLLDKARVRVLPPTFEVAIKLKASKKAALGAHLLRGKITYQPIFDKGVLPPQEMDLALPITVVDKDTISLRNPEYMRDYPSQADTRAGFTANSKGDNVGPILLAPIVTPLVLLDVIACKFWGEDCGC